MWCGVMWVWCDVVWCGVVDGSIYIPYIGWGFGLEVYPRI